MDLDPPPVRIETRSKTGEELEWDQELHPPKVRLGRTSARPYRLTYIPYPRIELRTFSALAGPQLEGFLESAEKAKDQAVVLIDLRGNSGGSDRYGTEWLQRLFGSPTSGWEVLELVSPVTLQGDVLLHQWLLSRAASPSEKEQVGGRLASALKNLEEAEAVGLEPEWKKLSVEGGSAPRTSASPFQGRLILLVDSNTSSSAETFVLMAKQFPETVVLGENTHGMMRFGEVKLYRLPNSGIWIQAGSKHFRDPTGEFQEGRGFLPDYWIEDSEPISEIVTGVVSAVAGD